MKPTNEKAVTFTEAAAMVGIGRDNLRQLAIKRGAAIRVGGGKNKVWLKIMPSRARELVANNIYLPEPPAIRRPRRDCSGASDIRF